MPNWLTQDRLVVIVVFAALLYFSGTGASLGWHTLWYLVVLIPSVILHEISHGWLADRYGDPTARNAGRLTLNPIKHVDPVGTVILPLLLSITGLPAFGYARPVPVNTTRMSRNQSMFVGLVGPFTNILLAALGIAIFAAAYALYAPVGVLNVVVSFGVVNTVLAVFNLIPIPPLDGSSVIERFLPQKYMNGYYLFRRYSMFLLLIIVLTGNNIIGDLFNPFIHLWYNALRAVVPGAFS